MTKIKILTMTLLSTILISTCAYSMAQPQTVMQTKTVVLATDTSQEKTSTVTISTLRDPVDKSFRKMMSGLALYEKHRALAPDSTLRFKLLPRQIDVQMETVSLKVLGDSFSKQIPIASDFTFTLEMDEKAMREDASVRPNRKVGSLTWRAQVRTPGLPDHVYRLGDLRLSCLVGKEAGLISNHGFMGQLISMASDFCNDKNSNYLFFSEKPLFNVVLEAGARSLTIPVDRLYAGRTSVIYDRERLTTCDCQVLVEHSYFLPLGDLSWPNDTLVKIEYMDDALTEKIALVTRTDSKH
jgi:hypothetical protein